MIHGGPLIAGLWEVLSRLSLESFCVSSYHYMVENGVKLGKMKGSERSARVQIPAWRSCGRGVRTQSRYRERLISLGGRSLIFYVADVNGGGGIWSSLGMSRFGGSAVKYHPWVEGGRAGYGERPEAGRWCVLWSRFVKPSAGDQGDWGRCIQRLLGKGMKMLVDLGESGANLLIQSLPHIFYFPQQGWMF